MKNVYVIGRDPIPEKIELSGGESLEMTVVALPGCRFEGSVEISLTAPGASLDLAGLCLCPEDGNVSLAINVRHESGGCVSRQLFKSIAGGDAHIALNGLVYVRKDAQKTSAAQEMHSLLLSDRAVVEACPQLEVYADDVECSHGTTSGYLDEQQQFYMRSRGITAQEARRLQLISFISPVAARVDGELRKEIDGAIA